MKKFIHIIAFLVAMLAVASCVEPLDSPTSIQGQTFSLSFSCGVMTKADNRLATGNEDLIKQIDYFFFPLNTKGTVDDEAEYLFQGTYKPSDHNLGGLEGTYTETLDHSALKEIFPDGATKAMVFAVANFVDKYGAAVESPNTTIPEDAKTWKALHDLEVGESFFKNGGAIGTQYFGLRWPRKMEPDDEALFFVMTGEEIIDMHVADNEIPLKRLASKITVNFTYENYEEVKESGNIMWVPQPSGEETRVYLSNAIEHTTLGGPLTRDLVADSWGTCTKPEVHNGTPGDGSRDIFEYAYDFMNNITTTTSDNKKLAHYYTYPISMKEGDDNQPYIKLVLPWYGYKNYGTDQQILYKQKEVYYKIVIPSATINEGNRIYEYDVTVNIIGSDKEVGITGEYLVKNWLTQDPISSSVATGRYISLDIPKNEYDMYVNQIDISYVSSGKVIAYIDEIYQLNYSNTTVSKDYFMQNNAVTATTDLKNAKRVTNADIQGWVTVPENTSYLRINHVMDNRMMINNAKNDAFDMAPYVFKVTLHLEEAGDDTTFDRTVTITQYPSMFVTSRKSNGYAFLNSWTNTRDNNRVCYDDRGQIYQDSYHIGNFAKKQGDLDGNVSGTNNNPNIYIISSSILSDDSYVIGDPRSQTTDNLNNLSGLENYKPTSASGTEKIIAPKLLIASSYGSVSQNYYFNLATAQKRCAAYQEDGYPAGRWRVPTYAEIKFMVTLSRMGFIPSLFNFSSNDYTGYWSANGKVYGDQNGLPQLDTSNQYTTNTAVRCVYDAWYWGEDPYQESATTWLGYHD